MRLAKSLRLAGADEAAGKQTLALAAAEHAIVDQAHLGHGGVAVALLGHAAQAEHPPPGGAESADRGAVDADRGLRRDGALARQRQQQLVLAVAGDPGDAEDLAGADLEADALEVDAVRLLARQVQAVDGQARLTGLGTFAPDQRAHLRADHQLRHAFRGLDLGVAMAHDLAAAQDGGSGRTRL